LKRIFGSNEDPYELPPSFEQTDDGSGNMWVDDQGQATGIYANHGGQPSEDELLYLGAVVPQTGRGNGFVQQTYDSIKRSPLFHIVAGFSCTTNLKKLFGPAPGDMRALNGIRVLSLMWVILGMCTSPPPTESVEPKACSSVLIAGVVRRCVGHVYSSLIIVPQLGIATWKDTLQNFRIQAVFGGVFAVDSFFMLSGFLAAYLFITQVKDVCCSTSHSASQPASQPVIQVIQAIKQSLFWRLTCVD
jgi:hypothetical protein